MQPDDALAGVEGSEKLMRERSIRSNRRQKFVACITSEDVSMGTSHCSARHDFVCSQWNAAQLRKLAWNGVSEDLRPIAWPLLLVCHRLRRCSCVLTV